MEKRDVLHVGRTWFHTLKSKVRGEANRETRIQITHITYNTKTKVVMIGFNKRISYGGAITINDFIDIDATGFLMLMKGYREVDTW